MKSTSTHKQALHLILDRTFTPLNLRKFVLLCCILALPLIRYSIASGKLKLDMLPALRLPVIMSVYTTTLRLYGDLDAERGKILQIIYGRESIPTAVKKFPTVSYPRTEYSMRNGSGIRHSMNTLNQAT
ncbi:MAG: hypothetical protein NTU47_11275 [Ignavibacteriales bacterium]|nr:hypothetical protein [Ignavibacteriales bacterium]